MVEGGMLSPEEIEALLSNTQMSSSPAPASRAAGASAVSAAGDETRRAAFEKIDRAVLSGMSVASILLGRELTLASLGGTEMDPVALAGDPGGKAVAGEFSSPEGKGALLLTHALAGSIADLMMGGTGKPPEGELEEALVAALKEALSQILSAISSSLAREGAEIRPALSSARVVDLESGGAPLAGDGGCYVLRFRATGQDLPEGEFLVILSGGIGKRIASGSGAPAAVATQALGTVAAVKFPALTPKLSESQSKNIELLLDVPMHITVELGRTTRMIREVLNLGTGSIIELDKLAGEPVDLLVNGKLIAKGEVVVIDESFGVRVTEIVSPVERIAGVA